MAEKKKGKGPIAGFKDPVTRPRFILYAGIVGIGLCALMVVMFSAFSTRFFCANGCHKVQDDSILAYESSSHSEISCIACHMIPNEDPVRFLIAKVKNGLGMIPTIMNTYELPLNPGSELSLNEEEMGSGQCTQCHSANRKLTPGPGIIIDHKAHAEAEAEVTCTMCHNRVAHPENFELTLKDPKTGEPNKKHPNYMKMKYCFRCHNLEGNPEREGEWKAPGECSACHPAGFDLKPKNHYEAGFYPKGHAEMGKEDEKEMEEAKKEAEAMIEEGIAPQLAEPVSYCGSCHVKKTFCTGCHGMEIPHPEAFKTKEHPEVSKAQMDKCIMCHGQPKETFFCDECHHGEKSSWKFDKAIPWENQHATTVSKNGIDACLKACHTKQFCLDCHTAKQPFPSSHREATWLHRGNPDPFAKDKAIHAKNAAAKIESCEICHGDGGTQSAFCMGCHKLPMPHEAEFKKFHSKTGRENPKMCQNCHQFAEICSNCHHEGSTPGVSWRTQHAVEVGSKGSASCFKACHKKDFCNDCHNRLKPLPASHKQGGWTRRPALDQKALHPAAFDKDKENCTFCHGDGGTQSAFCMGCHQLPMPHASGYGAKDNGGQHQKDLTGGTSNKGQCQTCHVSQFCDGCHHDYTGAEAWYTHHDDVVKASNPEGCFKCHEETYCSYCHVRLPRR